MYLRKTKFYFSLLVIVSSLFGVSIAYCGNIPNFTIMTENWAPYNFKKDGVVKGISSDMLVLILKKVGSKQTRSDIKIYPWARAYKYIQKRPNSILYTTTRTQEREDMFKWVGPIFEIEFNIYALKSKKIKINSFEDLKKYKIGTLRDDVVENLLVKNAGMKVSDFSRIVTNLQNIKKLFCGRVDLVAQTKDTTLATCKEAGIDPDLFESVFTLDKKSMYYAFHKETSDFVIKKFQDAFDDIKNQGKLAEILSKYGK